jgi:UPF0716 protein FxsA
VFRILVILFVLLPVVELTLIFKLGGWIGWIPTLLLVFGAGLAGAAIARVQGFMAAVRVRQQLVHGVLPASELVDGLLIGVAGVLLILPGVLSDVLGILLLIPPVRAVARRRLMAWFSRNFRIDALSAWREPQGATPGGDKIIDARVIETRVVPD